MHRLIFLLAIIFLPAKSEAQTFWMRYSPTYVMFNSSVVTPDNGLIVATNYTDSSWLVPRLMRIDSSGNIVWSKQMDLLPDTGRGWFVDVIATHDSCYMAGGAFYEGNSGMGGIFIHKFDSNGDTKWSRVLYPYSCSNNVTGGYSTTSIIETADKGFAISGTLAASMVNAMFLLKTDSAGYPEWFRCYDVNPYNLQYMEKNLCQDQDSGFVIFDQPDFLSQDAILVHVDKSGNLIWSATLDSTNVVSLNSISNLNGEVYFTFGNGFAKSSLDSTDIHMKVYTPPIPSIEIRSISKCSNGDFALAYMWWNGTNLLGSMRTDSSGNIKTAHSYNATVLPDQMTELPDGRFLLQGTGTSGNDFYTDVLLLDSAMNVPCYNDSISFLTDTLTERLRFSPVTETICHVAFYDPVTTWHKTGTAVDFCATENLLSLQPSGITVSPNPSTGKLRLSGVEEILAIELYAISGQKLMMQKINGSQVDFDLSSYPKGVYFIRVVEMQSSEVFKIILE
jgi:hypothetical protein